MDLRLIIIVIFIVISCIVYITLIRPQFFKERFNYTNDKRVSKYPLITERYSDKLVVGIRDPITNRGYEDIKFINGNRREGFALPRSDRVSLIPPRIERYASPTIISTSSGYRSFGTVLKSQSHEAAVQSQAFRTIKLRDTARKLPTAFDGRVVWGNLLSPISDQGTCGNCWAHSSSHVLADRYAILSLGQIRFNPSASELPICNHNFTDIKSQWENITDLKAMDDDLHANRACNGSTLYEAADTLYTDGVTDIGCFPDRANVNGVSYDVPATEDSTKFPYCYTIEGLDFDTCVDQQHPIRKYRAQTAYNIQASEAAIMHEIYHWGPVIVGFIIFPDFMYNYDGKSIYTHPNVGDKALGGHAVRIVGWGEEMQDGVMTPYWIIANSWGTSYGDNGYFKIKRNIAECQMEQNCVAVLPDFIGMIIQDPTIIPLQTQADIDEVQFSGHKLDPVTGYYQTGIDKVKAAKLIGTISPLINENFPLPDFSQFWAADVNAYIAKIPSVVAPSAYPVIVCNVIGGTVNIAPDQAPSTVNNPGVVKYNLDVTPVFINGSAISPIPSPGPSPSPSPYSNFSFQKFIWQDGVFIGYIISGILIIFRYGPKFDQTSAPIVDIYTPKLPEGSPILSPKTVNSPIVSPASSTANLQAAIAALDNALIN